MDSPALLAPETAVAGRYKVVRILSTGGMGTVYEATHLFTKKRVALKVLYGHCTEDFEREASLTAALDCPHIVQVLDAGIDEPTDAHFIVMELLQGESLAAVLRQRGRLPAAEVLHVLWQIARAVDFSHASGIVHRDLKPENVFITNRDGAPHVKVLDFGIAKMVTADARVSRCLGTPLYMAPEQLSLDGTITPATDLYALAQIAFTLLVGNDYWRHEANADPLALSLVIIRGLVTPASERAAALGVTLSTSVDPWFARACAKDPSQRWPSATALVDALAAILREPSFVCAETSSGEVRSRPISTPSLVMANTALAQAPPAQAPSPAPSRPAAVSQAQSRVLSRPVPAPSGSQPSLSEDDAVYDRFVDVLAAFFPRDAAAIQVRRAVAKVCDGRRDASRLEYVVEEVMAGFSRTLEARSSICIALVDFCERERRARTAARSGPTGRSKGRST